MCCSSVEPQRSVDSVRLLCFIEGRLGGVPSDGHKDDGEGAKPKAPVDTL